MTRYLKFFLLIFLFSGCHVKKEAEKLTKPTVYIIGDSTVKNGEGDGAGGLWGWGDPIVQFFDTSKVVIENHALGGTSSRTYRTNGLWENVLNRLNPGDYVLMQFGHNDNGPLNDNVRARGTIHGIGEEIEEIDNMRTGEHEVVHTYGWYLRQYITEAKAKGAISVVFSPIPRNDWNDEGKVIRNDDSYGKWAHEVASFEEVCFVDLNKKMALAMDKIGEDSVSGFYFFRGDNTHTSAQGAVLAASKVVEGLKELEDCNLKDYLLANPVIKFPVKRNVWIIGDSSVADGKDNVIGWGSELYAYMDTTRVNIFNKARGSKSSRSYRYEGLWKKVWDQLKEGDFLLVQFGQNDSENPDQPMFRGTLKGMSDSVIQVTRQDGTMEIVHTYGWYMKKYISEAKEKGVSVIVISQIPGNIWHNGKVERVDDTYGKWAKEAATDEDAFFIDLNNAVAEIYETMGPEMVKEYFPKDQTHTNEAGAKLNALTLAQLIYELRECKLRGYVELK